MEANLMPPQGEAVMKREEKSTVWAQLEGCAVIDIAVMPPEQRRLYLENNLYE